MTLAEAAAMPIGSVVTIDEALVINPTRMSLGGDNIIQLRDDTRAVAIFAASGGVTINDFLAGATTGDVISFTATTQSYQGLFELTEMTGPATKVSTPTIGTSIEPAPATSPDFDDYSPTAEGLESRYVALQGIELFYFGTSAAGGLFQKHTDYIARDAEGNETRIWARSQASVDALNAYFGTIPAGYFDLPGILVHAFDRDDPLPGTAGVNYILNPVFVSIPGDLNMDGFVGIADLNLVLSAWNQSVTPGSSPAGDPSGDGFVGIEDLNAVLGNWNNGTPPGSASTTTPEPGTLALLAVTGTALLRRKTR
ncbi:MAG: PEP-CTERM sorting domain-containing protein [Phycisphaerales bacterium]